MVETHWQFAHTEIDCRNQTTIAENMKEKKKENCTGEQMELTFTSTDFTIDAAMSLRLDIHLFLS